MDATRAKRAARRAARALFDVARSQRADLDRINQDLIGFASLVASHPDLRRVLISPAVPASPKVAIVRELSVCLNTSAIVLQVLELLASRHVFALLPDLTAEFQRQTFEHRGIVKGIVTTAIPLDESQARRIAEQLGRTIGRTVLLERVVDPAIIGGVIATVGNTVFDGSIAGQLRRMKQHLLAAPIVEPTPVRAHS